MRCAPFLVDHRAPLSRPRAGGRCCRAASSRSRAARVVQPGSASASCRRAATPATAAAQRPTSPASRSCSSLRASNRIRNVDALNYSLTAEAGCVLANVQQAAAEAERFFPLSLGSEGSCQIGGNLSTNAGGTSVLRYGMMRDLVLGLEVVLADGRVLSSLSALRKDNTGYDLSRCSWARKARSGSSPRRGSSCFRRSARSATAFVAVRRRRRPRSRCSRVLREASGDRVSSFELIPRIAVELTDAPYPRRHRSARQRLSLVRAVRAHLRRVPMSRSAQVLEQALAAALERGLVLDAALAQSERERARALAPAREHSRGAAARRRESQTRHRPLPIAALAAVRRARRAPGCSRTCREAGSSPTATWAMATCISISIRRPARMHDEFLARGPHDQARDPRSGAGFRRQLQRRARHRPAQARRARALCAAGGARC